MRLTGAPVSFAHRVKETLKQVHEGYTTALGAPVAMSRPDISPYLVHFTSGSDYEDAFARLRKIITSRKLIAGSRYIKGDYRCVCFSEAPLTSLPEGLVNECYYSRYSPFGILVPKTWLFALGGRPVIYQTAHEFQLLPESHRWRHVLYELRESFERTDFSWEREWRIKCDNLEFAQNSAQIVVLNQSWANRLVDEHARDEDYRIRQYSLIFGEVTAEAYRDSFQWTILKLQ